MVDKAGSLISAGKPNNLNFFLKMILQYAQTDGERGVHNLEFLVGADGHFQLTGINRLGIYKFLTLFWTSLSRQI